MSAFKAFQHTQTLSNNCSSIRPEHLQKMTKFEVGLGAVLRNAWGHVEAIQTTDLPLLVSYCAEVSHLFGFVCERDDDE